jgi:hypothetical protein
MVDNLISKTLAWEDEKKTCFLYDGVRLVELLDDYKLTKPTKVRMIFTMGLPFTSQHGGQILFGPNDGNLYFMMGDGGGSGDPYNFTQNKKSLLGKVMRLDVDNIPSALEVSKLGLWGSYSIPKDNPIIEDKDMGPKIWALGLRNPWRCSYTFSQEKASTTTTPLSPSHASHLTYMKKHLEKECIIAMNEGNCYIFQTKPCLYFTHWDPGGCSPVHWKSQYE